MDCECFFCSEKLFSVNQLVGLPGQKSVVYEDNNIFVMPDISPLTCGHFLIISREHVNSFGHASESVFRSLEKAKDYLKECVFNNCEIFCFEHGAVTPHTAGACIDHAHMHIIPFNDNINVDSFIKQSEFVKTEKQRANYDIIHKFAVQGQPYLYYSFGEKDAWAYPVGRLPSQFFRMMIAQIVKKDYNWKNTYGKDYSKGLFKQTLALAPVLKSKKTMLDYGEKGIVQDVIYSMFPHLWQLHDDAVTIDVIEKCKMIMSTDPCPEPVASYFEPNRKYFHYGWMSVLINYSDLAAMGVEPVGILLSTIMPNDMLYDDYVDFLNGVQEACSLWGGSLLGGNVKEGTEFSVTGTSVGKSENGVLLRRKGINEDDVVCVIGDMGMFWLAVLQLQNGKKLWEIDDYCRSFLCSPRPKVREGQLLSQFNVSSCMDSSDGVIACLYELAEQNNVTICIDNESLIPNEQLRQFCQAEGLDFRNLMLSWGGWELVFTCPQSLAYNIQEKLLGNHSGLQIIGAVQKAGEHPVVLQSGNELYIVNDFSSKRFDKNSYFSFGIESYIKELKKKEIVKITAY